MPNLDARHAEVKRFREAQKKPEQCRQYGYDVYRERRAEFAAIAYRSRVAEIAEAALEVAQIEATIDDPEASIEEQRDVLKRHDAAHARLQRLAEEIREEDESPDTESP